MFLFLMVMPKPKIWKNEMQLTSTNYYMIENKLAVDMKTNKQIIKQ